MATLLDAEASGNTSTKDALPGEAGLALHIVGGKGKKKRKLHPQPHYEYVPQGRGPQQPGIYWVTFKTDPETGEPFEVPNWICGPLRVVAESREYGAGAEGWGRVIQFLDDDRNTHLMVPGQELHTRAGFETLLRDLLCAGMRSTMNRKDQWRISDYIQTRVVERRVRTVHHTGWFGDRYVLQDKTVGAKSTSDGEDPLLFAPASGTTLGTSDLSQRGTLERWIHDVAAPAIANTRLAFAISVGFSAVVAGLVGADGGGFHLFGPTSAGKTTFAMAPTSIFGNPDIHASGSFMKSWRATDNALEGLAASRSDMLLPLDELGQLDARYAGAAAYLIANGQGKARAGRDGALRTLATWRTTLISSGEVSMAALIAKSGEHARGGQQVRIVDIPIDAGAGFGGFDHVPQGMTGKAFSESLQKAAKEQYGTAFPAFLERLATDPASSRAALRTLRDRIAEELTPQGAAAEVARVATRFALVAAAGELATSFAITGWATGEAARGAAACFHAWLGNRRAGTGGADEAAMIAQVRHFLEANAEARFSSFDTDPDDPEHPVRTVRRAGFRKPGKDGPTFLIDREVFRQELCDGFDFKAVAKLLAKLGALETEAGGGTTVTRRLPDGRNVRVYVVTPAIWEAK